jgi:hypothetical protein
MPIYRYPPDAIKSLSERMGKLHRLIFGIFTAAICASVITITGIRTGWVAAVAFCVLVAVVMFATRHKSQERRAKLVASSEFEINDEKILARSSLGRKEIHQSEIAAVCFSKSGIWLYERSRRKRVCIPPEVENFDQAREFLANWVPQAAARLDSPASIVWINVKVWGIVALSALLLYVALASRNRWAATLSSAVGAIGFVWYFSWCGRKIQEHTWKVLLPLTGYFAAVALLLRALSLWIKR